MTAARFSRDPGLLALRAIHTEDVLATVQELPAACGAERVIAIDLSLGSWRLHQAASEVLAQLEQPIPPEPPPPPERSAGEVGRRADAETAGDAAVIEALRLAGDALEAFAAGPQTVVCVVPPAAAARVERHDAWFVRFLVQALGPTPHETVLVATAATDLALPADWAVRWSTHGHGRAQPVDGRRSVLALVPGVVCPPLAAALAGAQEPALPLPGGCLLIDPAARESARPERYEALAAAAGMHAWVAAYAMSHGSDAGIDPWWLFDHAGRLFRAGACEIPLALLTRVRAAIADPARGAVVDVLCQAVRVAHGRFVEAAAAADPAASLPRPLRGLLMHLKGWALTMAGRHDEAAPRLAAARSLLESDPETEEYLSVLNISALNLLGLGDWEEAYALERRVRSAIDRLPGSVWQFRYVNGLNLARLERRRGRFDNARADYREAFATAAGVRTDSDAIHANVADARIDEARDRPDEALPAWTRAALHWAACDVPEAVASRVTAAIARSDDVAAHGSICDAVCAAFADRLAAHATDRTETTKPPVFVRPLALSPAVVRDAVWRPVVGRGWAVLCAATVATPALDSPAARRLRLVLGDVVGAPGTVLVDDRLGRELPVTEAELVETTVRLGVRRLALDERVVAIPRWARAALEQRHEVHLGAAVDTVSFSRDVVRITFKRYRRPVELAGGARETIARLRETPSVAAHGDVALLRELERQRVVELRLASATFADLVGAVSAATPRS